MSPRKTTRKTASPYSVVLIPGSNPPEFLITPITPQVQLNDPNQRAQPASRPAAPVPQYNPYPQPGTSSYMTLYPQDGIAPSSQAGMPHNRVSLHPVAQANSQPVRPPSHAPPPPPPQNRAPTMTMNPPTLQQRYQSAQRLQGFPPEHQDVARRVNAAANQRGIMVPRASLPYPETPPQPIPRRLLSGGLPYPETAQMAWDTMKARDNTTANVPDERCSQSRIQRR